MRGWRGTPAPRAHWKPVWNGAGGDVEPAAATEDLGVSFSWGNRACMPSVSRSGLQAFPDRRAIPDIAALAHWRALAALLEPDAARTRMKPNPPKVHPAITSRPDPRVAQTGASDAGPVVAPCSASGADMCRDGGGLP